MLARIRLIVGGLLVWLGAWAAVTWLLLQLPPDGETLRFYTGFPDAMRDYLNTRAIGYGGIISAGLVLAYFCAVRPWRRIS